MKVLIIANGDIGDSRKVKMYFRRQIMLSAPMAGYVMLRSWDWFLI